MAKTGGKRGAKDADDLSIKERIFVREYLKHENGTKAVIAAGWAAKSAAVTSSKLLKKAKIQAAIAKVSAKVMDDLDVSVAQIVAELKRVGFVDPRKFFDADGRCKPITELDDNTAAAVAGMKTVSKVAGEDEDGMVVFTDYKIADKIKALELLGRYRKMFTDKVESSHIVTLEQLVTGSK